MTPRLAIALCVLLAMAAVGFGYALLRRAFARREVLLEEIALAVAWVFLVGGFVWLAAFLSGSSLLGFDAPWTWLAASHFAAAGFGALTITALACRTVSGARALGTLRVLLAAHPIAYLVTAAGISGARYCDELGAAIYELIFVAQLCAVVFGGPYRISRGPRRLLLLALCVPVWTLVPALTWAWGHPMFDLTGMIRYHGLVNAIGHAGFGLAAFAWGRPSARSPLRTAARRPVQT